MKPRKRPNRLSREKFQQEKEPQIRRVSSAKRVGRAGVSGRIRNYIGLHLHVLTSSLSQLSQTPLSNVMTAAVIGIALALPAAMHVFLDKVQSLGSAWQESAQISLFLKEDVTDSAAQGLSMELNNWSEVAEAKYITPTQALDDFKQHSGLGDAFGMLDQNPLPGVIVIFPSQTHRIPERAESLLDKLRVIPEVDLAQLDLEWVQRLHGLIAVADRTVVVLGGLLAIAVLFVIGNTIRMSIQNRQDEIEVIKLIGGSNAFVRRPFLYNGVWYGLFGGLVAWVLVNALLLLLNGPIRHLASLYGSNFQLGLVGFQTTVLLLTIGPLLGLAGAWLVAGRRLRAIEPA